jgi:Flp pilus assembly pilin Flp
MLLSEEESNTFYRGTADYKSLIVADGSDCVGLASGVNSLSAVWKSSVRGCPMLQILRILWTGDEGQDIAEYAVMLAVILVLVIGTVRLIGGNANNAFSSVASNLQ